MSTFKLPLETVGDGSVRTVLQQAEQNLNQIAQFIYFGTGAPSFTPTGPPPSSAVTPALYFRIDGGAGTSLYLYEPSSGWAAK